MRILNVFIAILVTVILFSCNGGSKTVVEKTAHVYGNCEKCKATIEKAAKIKGVEKADWNIDSKLITLKFDSLQTSQDDILKAIAAAGYDNDDYTGDDYAYQKLPDCCHYERKEN
jgi:copper chaperone CopZ